MHIAEETAAEETAAEETAIDRADGTAAADQIPRRRPLGRGERKEQGGLRPGGRKWPAEPPVPCTSPDAPHNRVRAIMAHGWRYAFQPTERLARDVGVSPRTIRRLLSGETKRPPYRLVDAVVRALSADLRLPIPLPAEEVFSPSGAYPTASTCALCDCPGCLPTCAFDRHDRRRQEYRDAVPGDWCRYPATGPEGYLEQVPQAGA